MTYVFGGRGGCARGWSRMSIAHVISIENNSYRVKTGTL